MAKLTPQQRKAAKTKLAAIITRKQADLDMIDDQMSAMPEMAPSAPLDMPISPEFDLLSQKREELEKDIQQAREGVELITAWEQFKGGPWSPEVQQALGAIDDQIASAAGPEVDLGMDLGAPALPAPAPVAPPSPAPAVDAIPAAPAPEAPVPVEEVPAPEAEAEEILPAEEPLPAPVASAISKKNNYEAQNKKGVKAQEKPTMANQETKPSLKAGLADKKAQRDTIKKEAQTRVASAWTIAKTMLPTAPAEAQKAFAASLLTNPTKVLTAALRQTAVNAHYTKFAEEFKKVHKMELNDLMEDPSVLSKEKSAVESEIKGDAKSASAPKVADDRKENGVQPEKYDDGRHGSEPAEIDAGKAADREADTINKSEGGSNKIKEAAVKTAECKCGKADCANCKAAAVKTAEPGAAPEMAPEAEMPAAPAGEIAPEAPMGDMPPAGEEMPMGEEGAGSEAETVLTEEKKLEIHEKIEEAEQAIQSLEEEILEEGNEELNIENIFNEEEMEDKVSSLANEGDNHAAGDEDGDFFAPSAAAEMESGMETDHFGSYDDFFSMQGADADPLAALIAGDLHTAAQVEGMEVLPAFTGELANHFNEMSGEGRDTESDHDGDVLAEAAEAVKPEEQGAKRLPQDSEPKLETPKEAKAKAASKGIRHIKAASAQPRRPVNPVAAALFGDGDDF
jgi:hypothetical protein